MKSTSSLPRIALAAPRARSRQTSPASASRHGHADQSNAAEVVDDTLITTKVKTALLRRRASTAQDQRRDEKGR